MSLGWQVGWYNGWRTEERMATLPVQHEAIRSGAMTKPITCPVCGETPQPNPANSAWLRYEDHADPLAACSVCRRCPRILHDRFDQREPWLALVRTRDTGDHWFEALTMDPASQRVPFSVTYPDGLPSTCARAPLDAAWSNDPERAAHRIPLD